MNKDYMYIVAGDLMQDKFNKLYPDIHTIPFRENFSKGSYNEPFFNEEFINNRCSVHNTTKDDYINKLDPIINLDFNKEYVLCFGEDECCKENLKFMIKYLKNNNYKYVIRVNIVDEETLELINEYIYSK